MTIWVILQKTDFCSTVWEERLYNAIVGVIYCFAFFNLKEGRSRNRIIAFYSVIIIENYTFLFLFNWFWEGDLEKTFTFSIAALIIVTVSSVIGLSCMLIYYRFFHPTGPIRLCVRRSVDFKIDIEHREGRRRVDESPDFEIEFEDANNQSTSTKNESKSQGTPNKHGRATVKYSRSFKNSCPGTKRYLTPVSPVNSSHSASVPVIQESPIAHKSQQERLDSAYGTDSNRTASRSTASPSNGKFHTEVPVDCDGLIGHIFQMESSPTSSAFNNETYMSCEKQDSGNNTYQSVHAPPSEDTVIYKPVGKLLKRSPIVKDVTTGFAQISQTESILQKKNEEGFKPPLTIIIPNISHHAIKSHSNLIKGHERQESDKTIPLEVLNPTINSDSLVVNVSAHDYENLALVNINRGIGNGIRHWKTYSDMANENHDESVSHDLSKEKRSYADYSSIHYFDIYPLSKEMKEQLYRSITPISTAATMASDTGTNITDSTSDTYEPIETYAMDSQVSQENCGQNGVASVPVTLIHHDGKQISTRQIVSLDSLKQVLQMHDKFPMEDPQDRGDLYLLAPMRLLTPIIEETEPEVKEPVNDFNRSIMTVISEMLTSHNKSHSQYQSLLVQKDRNPQNSPVLQNDTMGDTASFMASFMCPDGRFQDSVDSASSTLVHTIDEIRNQSLCNLYHYSTNINTKSESVQNYGAEPQVPSNSKTILIPHCKPGHVLDRGSDLNASVKSIKSNTLIPSPSKKPPVQKKRSPLYSQVGTRKNLLQLTETTGDILNTPNRKEPLQLKPRDLLDGQQTIFDAEIKATESSDSENEGETQTRNDLISLSSISHSMVLSPSSKYGTPTPPLRPNQFVRNSNLNRPRRKFSIIKEKFDQDSLEPKPKQMITSKRKNDLYENISDEYLELRNSVRWKKEEPLRNKSRSLSNVLNEEDNGPVMRRCGSLMRNNHDFNVTQRNMHYRRSISSVIECEKENYGPPAAFAPKHHPPPRALRNLPDKPLHLRPRSLNASVLYDVPRRQINTSRLCIKPSGTLSPNSKIFNSAMR